MRACAKLACHKLQCGTMHACVVVAEMVGMAMSSAPGRSKIKAVGGQGGRPPWTSFAQLLARQKCKRTPNYII